MPLSALFRDERIESWSMTADEWVQLKRDYRTSGLVMTCGHDGIPKTSRLGTQFFAHKSGVDCQLHEGGPESPEHLATKAAVARAAREIGWEAIIEFPAADRSWIADVLVSNGERMIAIEAQWSPQSLSDFERRQARYRAAGIECFWLTAPANSLNASTVPHYELAGDIDNLQLWMPVLPSRRRFALEQSIKDILQETISPVAEFVATSAAIKTQMSKCWNCDRWMSLWTVLELDLESRCGESTTLTWRDPWPLWAPRRHEQAIEAPIRSAFEKSDLPAAATLKLKLKRSDIAETRYVAMNCPSCGYVQGDGLIKWHWDASQFTIPFGAGLRLPFTDHVRARRHVCRDIGRGRCSQEPTSDSGYPDALLYPPAHEHVEIDGYREERDGLPPRGSKWLQETR
ncbi:competence protein CoiA [Homoserinimonas sp. A520]